MNFLLSILVLVCLGIFCDKFCHFQELTSNISLTKIKFKVPMLLLKLTIHLWTWLGAWTIYLLFFVCYFIEQDQKSESHKSFWQLHVVYNFLIIYFLENFLEKVKFCPHLNQYQLNDQI